MGGREGGREGAPDVLRNDILGRSQLLRGFRKCWKTLQGHTCIFQLHTQHYILNDEVIVLILCIHAPIFQWILKPKLPSYGTHSSCNNPGTAHMLHKVHHFSSLRPLLASQQ